MFATAAGSVRRNSASDFVNVPSAGKIAMKLGDDDRIIGVQTCSDGDDVFLAARGGKCIRFAAADVRLFRGRSSSGVRGMELAEGDRVISMSVLAHGDLSAEERDAYFRRKREGAAPKLDKERRAALAAQEQFLLTVRSDGFGKRTSSHDYRLTRRGGKGIINTAIGSGETEVVAAFPVADPDEIMLVTDGGQLIRCPVKGVSKTGRGTRGVTIFRLGAGERVVSAARLADVNGNGAAGEAAANAGAAQDG
jgi:DNA gyrase subunit A